MSSVNGLELPHELVTLLGAGRWNMPQDNEGLDKLGIEDASDLDFLSQAAMTQNTNRLKQMVINRQGEMFGLVAAGGSTDDGHLDVTKAVVIAATRGQEALCLDYSAWATPRVVATHYGSEHVRWVEVARSFNELMDILNIR